MRGAMRGAMRGPRCELVASSVVAIDAASAAAHAAQPSNSTVSIPSTRAVRAHRYAKVPREVALYSGRDAVGRLEAVFQSDPATQMGMGLDPDDIKAVNAALRVWDEDGCLESFFTSKLTRRQVQRDSGPIQARRKSQRCSNNVKLELQHLATATSAVTSQVATQRHVDATQATWDAVWGEYLHPKWGGKAMLQASRKVVERPNNGRPTNKAKGYVVIVDAFRTSRGSSAMNSPYPRDEELGRNKPTRPKGGNTEERLPAQGQQYQALGFKKLRDRAPKARTRLPVAQ
ncbi:hypothetical protein QJQ45_004675 [Haematococcus lacustris]|nr:hypothetical protein QJQ45_004675 [Haematococcus lacustris]